MGNPGWKLPSSQRQSTKSPSIAAAQGHVKWPFESGTHELPIVLAIEDLHFLYFRQSEGNP